MKRCDLCGAGPERQSPTWPDAAAGSGSHGYVTCGACGLVFDSRDASEADLAEFHREEYAAAAGTSEPERLAKLDPLHSQARLYAPAFQRWARGLLGELRGAVRGARPAGRPLRLFEVGCASGGILQAARELGMEAAGAEVSPEAAAYGRARGLDIRLGLLEDLALPAGAFDIVLLHDVIEHVPSPMALLKECARLLAPGGVLCAHTVNVASATARLAGHEFFLADLTGGHVALFSPTTLRAYCTVLGLEWVRVRTHGFRLVQREKARAALRGSWRRPFIRLLENLGHEWVKRTGRGHMVLFIARKP